LTVEGEVLVPGLSALLLPAAASLTIAGGQLTLDNGGQVNADHVLVTSSGVTQGEGSLLGALSDTLVTVTAGTVRPGASPGFIMIFGDLILGADSVLELEAGGLGANPGVDYDQIMVTGAVQLDGELRLHLINNFDFGEEFLILSKLSGGAIAGTFQGLPEGGSIYVDSLEFQISYVAGDGNDVRLLAHRGLKYVTHTGDAGPGSLRRALPQSRRESIRGTRQTCRFPRLRAGAGRRAGTARSVVAWYWAGSRHPGKSGWL
jgi:hypothetical protein